MSEYKEIDRSDLAKNELLKDGTFAIDNDYFILGDKLDTVWWKQINHEKLSTGQVGSGYEIDFADGTQLKLSTLQLFSIINDYNLTHIDTKRWTLHELDANTWKGTIRKQKVYKDVNDTKVYEKIKQEEE
mgnify:CR=1 FL=1|jgi:hypothetical protein|tara:strand:+ start:1004 stop:1393 length:390 start_codon:yes stop_codon:yes gene_type:complete